jgi:hypothetical protein
MDLFLVLLVNFCMGDPVANETPAIPVVLDLYRASVWFLDILFLCDRFRILDPEGHTR